MRITITVPDRFQENDEAVVWVKRVVHGVSLLIPLGLLALIAHAFSQARP